MIFFHLPIYLPVLRELQGVGYGGVDIFVFASGIGCYTSLENNKNTFIFLKNRCKKVLSIYYVFIFTWILYCVIIKNIKFKFIEILGNIILLGGILGLRNQFNWYTGLMVITYVLAPICFFIIKKNSAKRNYFFLLSILIIVILWSYLSLPGQILISRIPTFLIGMIIGKFAKMRVEVKKVHIIAMMTLFIIGNGILIFCHKFLKNYLSIYGLYWHPFTVFVPSLCLLLSLLLFKYKKICEFRLFNLLNSVGKHTFSIYLIHLWLFDIVSYLNFSDVFGIKVFLCILSLIGLFPLCYILEKIGGMLAVSLFDNSKLFRN